MKRLDHYWQTRNPVSWALYPLSLLFCAVAGLRRLAYRSGMLVSHSLPVPVIVVGNISVGGTGKTPLVVWLVRYLQQQGFKPGVLIRGYRGEAKTWPQEVTEASDSRLVGDEAVLLARRCVCPVVAGPDRVDNAHLLVDKHGCDLLVSDDGLQHYALNRDLEIAVMDGERRLGNGFCLPAGPLRERPSRLKEADLVLVNGRARTGECAMSMAADRFIALKDPMNVRQAADFRQESPVAVAGIGNPQRFFSTLESMGLKVRYRPFPDHHGFTHDDFTEFGCSTVLMTEKDAVKCEAFANDRCWYLPVDARPDADFIRRLERFLTGLKKRLKENG